MNQTFEECNHHEVDIGHNKMEPHLPRQNHYYYRIRSMTLRPDMFHNRNKLSNNLLDYNMVADEGFLKHHYHQLEQQYHL